VSSTDYNGDTIVAKINLSSTTAKIEAANIDLVGQVSFSDLDSSVQSKIDAKADAISLGNIAYADMISQAMLDTTIIAGGYIKSSLLTASNIITGTLSADRIDTSGLYAERLYAPGYDANYMSLGSGSFFDLIMYQSNSEIFRIYDAGSSIVLMSHETPFLESGDGYTYAYNTWDFSNATVSGLKVVAVFG
jgi:hypothetical protein